MRILTVRQPWAYAIIHLGKDVENRSTNIAGRYRGPVAIHVAQMVDEDAYDPEHPMYGLLFPSCPHRTEPTHNRHFCTWCMRQNARARTDYRGGIIGVVDLVDVHSASVIGGCGYICHDCPEHGTCRDHCSPWAEGPAPHGGWMQHLVLANPRPLVEPIPHTGALGLRRLDDATITRIHEAIA